jgi:O-antigen/teichoic acid export membrane protein
MYGPAQLGLYVLGLTVIQVANTLSQMGLDTGIVRYVAKYRAEGDDSRLKGAILLSLWVSLVISVGLSGLIFFGSGFLANTIFNEPTSRNIFQIFAISLPFLTVMTMALWVTQGFQIMKYTAYVQQICRPLTQLILIVAFYFLGAQILGAALAYVLSMAIGVVLSLYYLRHVFPALLDKNASLTYEARALLSASWPMMVVSVGNRLNSWLGTITLGVFATASSVGIYNAAARTAALSTLVFSAFTMIFAPMASSLYSTRQLDKLDILYRDVSRWTFTAALAIFLVSVLLAEDILAIFGSQFVAGSVVLMVMSIGYLSNSLAGPAVRVLAMTGHQRVVLLVTVGSAITSIIMAITLVPIFGVIGAGIATAAPIVLTSAVALLAVNRLLNLWPLDVNYLRPLTAGFVAGAVTESCNVLLSFLPAGILSVLTLGSLFMIVFASMLWALGLAPSDRRFLSSLQAAFMRALK